MPGEREALRRQTVRSVALIPVDALKVREVEVGERIHAVADAHAAACRCAIRMHIRRIQACMIVEVLLHMDDIKRREQRPYIRRVLGRVGA